MRLLTLDRSRFILSHRDASRFRRWLLTSQRRKFQEGAGRSVHLSAQRRREVESEVVKNQRGHEFRVFKSNKDFDHFYRAQNTCPDWEQCLDYMRRDLPQSIRVNHTRPQTAELLQNVFADLASRPMPSQGLELRQQSWNPYVWQLSKSRWDLFTDKHGPIKSLIRSGFSTGSIARQELVSMMPVHFLDIQPHHKVLDMCAAPGSKTKQALEFIHARGEMIPEGLVVANEYDPGRCLRLANNCSQYGSSSLMMTNHEGSRFPDIPIQDPESGEIVPVKYDRIICDVPCSGDGTIRKNPNIWINWNPGAGNHRHQVQYRILRRSVELLVKDGLIAYSSCAINPIENEAVLQRVLDDSEGALEIVLCPPQPGINYLPGHTDWRVFDSNMREYKQYEDVPENIRSQVRPGMFPSGRHSEQLKRSMRFLPHLMNDGGFFVALLRKTQDRMPWEHPEVQWKVPERREVRFSSKVGVKRWDVQKGSKFRSVWLPISSKNFRATHTSALEEALNFYNLPATVAANAFYIGLNEKSIRLANPNIRSIVGARAENDRSLNIFHLGCRFLKAESKTVVSTVKFRPALEASGLVPFFNRPVCILPEDLRILLELGNINQLVDFRDRLSTEAVQSMCALDPPGNCKLVVCLHPQTKNEIILEMFGFVGVRTVEIYATKAAKYHFKLALNPSDIRSELKL